MVFHLPEAFVGVVIVALAGSARCSARPMRPSSQPTPTAPGPNGGKFGSMRATCSSSRRVCLPSAVSVTVTQLMPPPISQVAARRFCGTHSVMVPPALPRTVDGRPDLAGIWKARSLGAADDLVRHGRRAGVAAGRGVVVDAALPYQPWAAAKKLEENREKYPVEKSRGSNVKYNEL